MTATFTARTPSDIIALAPVVIGFQPTDSIVMMTFGAARTFHARIDLPRDETDVPHIIAGLIEPCVQHEVQRVIFLAFGHDEYDAAHQLALAAIAADIEVISVLYVVNGRWRAHGQDEWHEIDSNMGVQAAVDHGIAPLTSRDSIRQLLDVVPTTRDPRIEAIIEAIDDPDTYLAELHARTDFRALVDEVIGVMQHANTLSDAHREMLTGCMAYVAWYAGDGALAWLLHDRAPDHAVSQTVARLLRSATPPPRA